MVFIFVCLGGGVGGARAQMYETKYMVNNIRS